MNLRTLPLGATLAALLATVSAQNLFNTSTTGPAPKRGSVPQPIEIQSSGQASFSMRTDTVTYQKNVRVNDPQFFLHCEHLVLQLDLTGSKGTNRPAGKASTPPPATTPGTNAAAGPLTTPFGGGIRGIREVDATGGVFFSNKVDGSHALADRIQYFATNDTFELTGNAKVVKNFGVNNVITNSAQRILFLRAKGEFISLGDVTTQGGYTPPAKKTNAPAGKSPP